MNGIAYAATFEPQIGQMITETARRPRNLRRFALALRKALAEVADGKRELVAIETACALVQIAPLARFDSDREAIAFARAYLSLIAHATAAVFGELRYAAGYIGSDNTLPEFQPGGALEGEDRDEIYEAAKTDPFPFVRRLRHVAATFRKSGWPKSFGGKKWAVCATRTAQAALALRNVAVSKKQAQAATWCERLEKRAHLILNSVHNGGPLLSKFGITKPFLNLVADAPSLALLSAELLTASEESTATPLKVVDARSCLRLEKLDSSETQIKKLPPSPIWLSFNAAGVGVPCQYRWVDTGYIRIQICPSGHPSAWHETTIKVSSALLPIASAMLPETLPALSPSLAGTSAVYRWAYLHKKDNPPLGVAVRIQ